MSVLRSTEDNADGSRTCFWYATEEADQVDNVNGVKSPHLTTIVHGEALLEIDGRPPRIMSSGEEIELPTNTRYTFTCTVAPLRIECHYPEEAKHEIDALVAPRELPRVWPYEFEFNPADWKNLE